MLKIDTETFSIGITRGDAAYIEFSAVDEDGETYVPTEGDKLCFAVSKAWGKTPLMNIETVYDPEEEDPLDKFWTINIQKEDWLDENGADLFKFIDYVYDVQIITSAGEPQTIIGKTDEISPTFTVWGEAAEE